MDETGMDSNSDISMNLNNVEDIDELPRSMIHISPITSRPIPKGTTSIARLASSNDSSFNDDDLPLAPCTEEPPTLFQFGSTTSSDFTFASLPLLFPASTATRSDEAQGLSASQQMVLEMTRRMVEFRPPVTANGGSKWTSGDASASASSRIGKRKAGEDKSDKSGFDRIHERQFMKYVSSLSLPFLPSSSHIRSEGFADGQRVNATTVLIPSRITTPQNDPPHRPLSIYHIRLERPPFLMHVFCRLQIWQRWLILVGRKLVDRRNG